MGEKRVRLVKKPVKIKSKVKKKKEQINKNQKIVRINTGSSVKKSDTSTKQKQPTLIELKRSQNEKCFLYHLINRDHSFC